MEANGYFFHYIKWINIFSSGEQSSRFEFGLHNLRSMERLYAYLEGNESN